MHGTSIELTPVLNAWQETTAATTLPLYPYPAGSWGPDAAEQLLLNDNREWRQP